MQRKKKDPLVISNKDFPQSYLTAPQLDQYMPGLETLNQRKRSLTSFSTRKFSAATEKFFRLYFYQGLDKVDRLLIHTEYLEMKAKRYMSTGVALITAITTFVVLGRIARFKNFPLIRIVASGFLGYTAFSNYRVYCLYSIELIIEPLYEKYRIK